MPNNIISDNQLTSEQHSNIDNWKRLFVEAYRDGIKRAGSNELLEYICSSDFFSSPASAKWHGSVPGGLCAHSNNVYGLMRELYCSATGVAVKCYSAETLAIVGLLHDICKIGIYKPAPDGGYIMDDPFPMGHGEKSVAIIQRYMKLSEEEMLAIRYHMGAWGSDPLSTVAKVFQASPLTVLLHIADLSATYTYENGTAFQRMDVVMKEPYAPICTVSEWDNSAL